MSKKPDNKRASSDYVHWVYCRGEEGFWVDKEWGFDLDDQGIRCPACKAFRADRYEQAIREIEHVIAWYKPKRLLPISGFGNLGGVIIHQTLLNLLDVDRLHRLCLSYPVLLKGKELKGFIWFVEKRPWGKFRGTNSSNINLCSECGRLTYWPMPVSQRYLLRSYWNGKGNFTILGSNFLASSAFFDNVLKGVPRITSEKYALRDDPLDGLPVPYDELVEAVRKRIVTSSHGTNPPP